MSDIIQIAYGETQMALENEVMKAVCKVGINVNKEELLKALELSEFLVRCGECKHWQDNNGGYPTTECRWGHDETPDADDFCSYGERRNNE